MSAHRVLSVSLLSAVLSTACAATAQAARLPIATFEIGPDETGAGLFDGVAAVNNISGSLVGTIDVPALTFVGVSLRFCDGSVSPSGEVSMDAAAARCGEGPAFTVPLEPVGPGASLKYDYLLSELFASPDQPWLFVAFTLDEASRHRLGAGHLLLNDTVPLGCSGDDCVRTVYFEPVPEPASMLLVASGLAGLVARRRFQRS